MRSSTSSIENSVRATPLRIKLGAALLLLLIGLAAAEGIARLARVRPFTVEHLDYIGWAEPDVVLGWRNRPGVHPAHEGPQALMTMLPDGSRATGASGNGRKTIVLVGCSFTAGYGVRDDETFAWKLQERFPDFRVLNFGTPGYGTYQALLSLQQILERVSPHPAAVVYGFLPMHTDRNVLTYSMLQSFRNYGGELFSPPRVELRNGELRGFPPFVVSDWPLERRSAFVTLLHRASLRAQLANRARDEEEVTRLLLVQMKQRVEQAGGRFLVATLRDNEPPWQELYQRINADMRASQVEELNISYRGPETRIENLLVGGNGHPNGIVHAWWADQLSHWLADNLKGGDREAPADAGHSHP